jgi:IS5 family transposase
MEIALHKNQLSLFEDTFEHTLDHCHPLCILADKINWKNFDEKLGALFGDKKKRRPSIPTRVMVALHYLKYTYNLSDDEVVERFSENNYWQRFAGYLRFTTGLPCDGTTMVKWRKKMKAKGLEVLFEETINVAKNEKLINKRECDKVIVDTTVQEKNITFPTDAKLYHKARNRLVDASNSRGIKLRQSYVRLSKKALFQQARYARAKQMKRAQKEVKRLKTYLGRVYRNILREEKNPDTDLKYLLDMSRRLLLQKRNDSNKLYSLHEPEVECISKGKAHKKYEFGCKVSVVSSAKSNWILSIAALHGNPYDGHTLKESIDNAERLSKRTIKTVFVDQGYRGSIKTVPQDVFLNGGSKGKKSRTIRKWLRRRAAIEPIIGHLKSDHRMNVNYLKGKEGDRINAILTGCGFNLAKLLAAFFLSNFIESIIININLPLIQ